MIGWTLCSGIGTPEASAPFIDWQLACEMDPFARQALEVRLRPPVLHDDMNTLTIDMAPLPDVIVAGTPCQAFSIAGLQKGLHDERGNLTLKFVEIVRDVVTKHPHHHLTVVWENVPGVLSDKTNAFGCLLGGLVGASEPIEPPKLKGRKRPSWPGAGAVEGPVGRLAWRTLDAQHFGVPQRRRRVFLVASFGDGADPAAVLFERAGGFGHPPQSRQTQKEAVASADGGALIRGGRVLSHNPGMTLTARDLKGPLPEADLSTVVAEKAPTIPSRRTAGGGLGTDFDTDGGLIAADLAPTLRAGGNRTGGDRPPGTDVDTADSLIAFGSKEWAGDEGPLSPPLRASPHTGSKANGGSPPAVAFDTTQLTSPSNYSNPQIGDPCHPLAAGARSPSVAVKAPHWTVRRLTPTECERLQDFPDGWTLIGWRGKSPEKCPDGPRYKTLGNAMARPVIGWILERIAYGR